MGTTDSHSAAFVALVEDAKARIRETDCQTLQQRQAHEPGAFRLLDVREAHEYAVDRIPGAQHLSKGVIERDIEALIPARSTPIVVYCGGGYRSALAADNLQRMGYTAVESLAGGIRAWREGDHPLESDERDAD